MGVYFSTLEKTKQNEKSLENGLDDEPKTCILEDVLRKKKLNPFKTMKKPNRFANPFAREGTFQELTAFDGEISIYFHVNARTGKPFDAYTRTANVDDEHKGLKKRHFGKIYPKASWVSARPEAIAYLWKRWSKWIRMETE